MGQSQSTDNPALEGDAAIQDKQLEQEIVAARAEYEREKAIWQSDRYNQPRLPPPDSPGKVLEKRIEAIRERLNHMTQLIITHFHNNVTLAQSGKVIGDLNRAGSPGSQHSAV